MTSDKSYVTDYARRLNVALGALKDSRNSTHRIEIAVDTIGVDGTTLPLTISIDRGKARIFAEIDGQLFYPNVSVSFAEISAQPSCIGKHILSIYYMTMEFTLVASHLLAVVPDGMHDVIRDVAIESDDGTFSLDGYIDYYSE